jgi:hypothetical protein
MFYFSNVLGFSLLPPTAIPERSETRYMFQTFWVFHFSSHCNPRTKWHMLYSSNVLGFSLLPQLAIPERSETCSTFQTFFFSPLIPQTAIPERSETCYKVQTFWAFHFFLTLQSQNEMKHVLRFKRSGIVFTSPWHRNPRTKWNMLYVSNVLGFSLLLTMQFQNEVKHVILFKRSGLFTSSSHCNPRTKWNMFYFSNVLGFSLLPHTAIPERSETWYTFQTFWVFDFFPTLQSQNEVKHVILFKHSGFVTSPSHRHPRTKWNMFYLSNVLGCSLLPHTAIPEWNEACYMFQTFWVFDFFLTLQSQTSETCYTVHTFWVVDFSLTSQSQNEVKHVHVGP